MILDRFRLTDKVAIVTGASAGIGRGSALAFADAGAHVVCAARTQDPLERLAHEVRQRGRLTRFPSGTTRTPSTQS